MYLKSLELSGYKSFAKKGELEFKTPITAIVGPNGSGKSNVAEAFRFALGEQSMKSMRGKRTEDLLFNGSAKHARVNRANVKLTFDNRQKLLDVDFDEVAMERTIHRDASTEYRINGSVVRLKDIIELLAGAHIGASGHHIISQGETDRILNVNPRERKVMIEDALGLKIYQYKKDESLRKLEKTELNIKEVESLRREIKPHIKFLKSQVEKVEKARDMKQELLSLYKRYFQRENLYIETNKKDLESKLKPLEESLRDIEKRLSEARETLDTLEHKEEASRESRELEAELQKSNLDKDMLVRELGRIEGALGAEERRIQREEERREALSDVIVSLSRVEELKDSIGKEIERASETEDVSVLRNIFSSIKSLISDFVITHKEQGQNTKSDAESLSELQKQKKDIEERTKSAEDNSRAIEEKLRKLRERVDKERNALRGAERSTYELKAEQSKVEMMISGIQGEKEKLQLEKEEFGRELAEAKALVGLVSAGSETSEDVKNVLSEASRAERKQDQKKMERLKIRLEDAGGSSGEEIMREYEEVSERDLFLERELEDLEKSASSLRDLIVELEEKLGTEFRKGVEKINKEFTELFALMFGGGSASLNLTNEILRKKSDTSLDFDEEMEPVDDGSFDTQDAETEEGIELKVSIPRKRIKGLQMLSGGERALTSIALLFAMSQVNPPPFLVLDETDAALDEANSRRYGDMIERLARHSQLILITHNRETMSRAGVLYGVTMGSDGASQLLSVDFAEAVKVAK